MPSQALRLQLALAREAAIGATPGERIKALTAHLVYVQYDPIATVAPSHWLTTHARCSGVGPDDIRRTFTLAEGLIECWMRATCFVTHDDYIALKPEFLRRRGGPLRYAERKRLGSDAARYARWLRRSIEVEGPVTASDLVPAPHGPLREIAGWGTRAARVLLGFLWYRGYVATTRRSNDRPVFDLVTRVIPAADFGGRFSARQHRALVDALTLRAVKSLVVATPAQIAWYLGLPVGDCRRSAASHLDTGELVPWRADYLAASREVDVLADLCADQLVRPAAISPFDPLVSLRDRLEALSGVRFRPELFTRRDARETAGSYPLMLFEDGHPVELVWLRAERARDRITLIDRSALPGTHGSNGGLDALAGVADFMGLQLIT